MLTEEIIHAIRNGMYRDADDTTYYVWYVMSSFRIINGNNETCIRLRENLFYRISLIDSDEIRWHNEGARKDFEKYFKGRSQ